ncbi:MAG: DUF429 domain-containing protein [Chloroflexi bacterium]|nr:DUF429 domain-containing protein [Chloroflexota bacterium]MDA1219823.1 DUF429 domain-containing protein [Chloroflexota bacterium]PKB57197.1 MAG: hypothetical protein BZY73_04415 [SAR202 cluster bacterium Casp-Chloro-G3]
MTISTNIIGVDFSGAKSDQNTWITQGIAEGKTLRLTECQPKSRAELTRLLADAASPTVAALDFPFSVPQSFAEFWRPDARTMPDLWAAADSIEQEQFIALRDRFVAEQGEPKRLADTYFPECYSCLHKANPNMVPMTFRGMQMLHQLRAAGCKVPPLGDADRNGTVLLEAMPGAALRAFGLPYKGYKNGKRPWQLRQQILEKLADSSSVNIQGLARFQERALQNHDCLDAIVAAVVATLWVRDAALFRCPEPAQSNSFDPVVMLEGWLYAPVFMHRRRQ